jgi:hypothetical protein
MPAYEGSNELRYADALTGGRARETTEQSDR